MTNNEKNPLVKNGFFPLGVQEIQGASDKITYIFSELVIIEIKEDV
ncbi:hypothetical protein [Bacillus thuringiensis]